MLRRALALFVLAAVLSPVAGFAEDGEEEAASEKARRAHDMAASDVIYQQEDFRALYYQNEQIIGLLKDLKDEVRRLREQGAQPSSGPAEDKG